MTDDKRKPGRRRAMADEDKMQVVSIRLTAAQRAKLQAIGVQRLRDWLDRAKARKGEA